jgi:hypothetical protein
MIMPFEKKFLKKWFSSQISSKPPSPQETEQKEKKYWKKEKKKKRKNKEKGKEEEKEKLQESLQIKGKSIFWEEKNTSTSKILFDVILFSPLPSYHFKNLSKIIEKVFLTLFWTIY